MITFQRITKSLILLLAVVGLFSCNDDDNTEPFNVIGDVFTTKRMINEEVQYARSYYAYGNQPMSAAIVTTADATEVTLLAVDNSKYSWAKPAATDDFSTDIPTEGTYQFDVLSEGVPHESFDVLEFNDMPFTSIISADVVNSILAIKWESSTEAEGYLVRLVNEAGDIVFSSVFISPQATQIQIDYPNTGSGTWTSGYPNPDDIYTLELQAFSFDGDASDLNYTYHIEEIAVSEDEVVWE